MNHLNLKQPTKSLSNKVMEIDKAFPAFVIEKTEGGKTRVDSHDGKPQLYAIDSDAEWVLSQMPLDSRTKRSVRLATDEERRLGVIVRPKRRTFTSQLVEIFADAEAHRFAISSKADDENAFVREFSTALAALPIVDEEIAAVRYIELLPLFLDICCKYRGYKAEKVHQRTVLIAGDLELPSMRLGEVQS